MSRVSAFNAGAIPFSLTGVSEIQNVLNQLADKHVVKIVRNTNYAIVGEVRDRIKPNIPVGKKGNLKKSVSLKNLSAREMASILYFKKLGFHWRFLEHGTRKMRAQPFLYPAIDAVKADLPRIIREKFNKVLEKQVAAELKRQARAVR